MTCRRLFLGLMAFVLAGCSRGQVAASRGRAAQRIVSLAPSTTEAIFAIGAGDRLVGRTRFCDYPPAALALPSVGDVEPDLEAILDVRPDLVVGIAGLTSRSIADQLEARGTPSWFSETSSLAAIDRLLLGLGERAGHSQDAKRLVHSIDEREQAILRAVATAPKPRVLFVVSVAPLVAAGPASFADELIRDAGGQNIVREGGAWPTLGFEWILDRDPDRILDASQGAAGATTISAQAPGWSGLRAVREGRVTAMHDPRVLRAGPRIAEGLAVLARALHPDLELPSVP